MVDRYREQLTIFSDGTLIITVADGTNAHGVWEPTGDATGTLTLTVIFEDGGRMVIRVSAEVAPDGQSVTGPYTNEYIDASGESSGEIGPGESEGTRMTVEAPGTPVASFEELFGEPDGTPQATPGA